MMNRQQNVNEDGCSKFLRNFISDLRVVLIVLLAVCCIVGISKAQTTAAPPVTTSPFIPTTEVAPPPSTTTPLNPLPIETQVLGSWINMSIGIPRMSIAATSLPDEGIAMFAGGSSA